MSTFQLTSSKLTTSFKTLFLLLFFLGSIHFTATAAHYQNVIEAPTVKAPTKAKLILCAQSGQTVSFNFPNPNFIPMYLPTVKINFHCSNMSSSTITSVPTIPPFAASQTINFTIPQNADLSYGGHLVLKIKAKDGEKYIKLITLSNCIGEPRPHEIE